MELDNDNLIEIPIYEFETLESVVIRLFRLKSEGKKDYFAIYNGVSLYSYNIDFEMAYLECFGCSRDDWFSKQKSINAMSCLDRWKLEAQQKVPFWISEGKKYIHPKKMFKWESYCFNAPEKDFFGLEIDKALEIMKMIDENVSYSTIKGYIESNGHSGGSYNLMMNLLLKYANKGPELLSFVNKKRHIDVDIEYISRMKEFNLLLDENYSYDEAWQKMSKYKIFAIEVLFDFQNNREYGDYRNYRGSILVDDKMNFEGVINNGDLITGSILDNGDGIIFAGFNNNLVDDLYFSAFGKGGVAYGTHDVRRNEINVTRCPIIIKFNEVISDFVDEIVLTDKIIRMKNNLDMEKNEAYEVYKNNIPLEITTSLKSISSNLHLRLIGSISNCALNKQFYLQMNNDNY